MSQTTQLVGDQHTRIVETLRARLTSDGVFPTAIQGLSSTLLVLPVSVPLIGEIVDASPSRPMLSMSMSLNLEELASTLREIPASYSTSRDPDSDCIVRPITVELLDALCRYVGLLSEPQAIPALAPAIRREIYART